MFEDLLGAMAGHAHEACDGRPLDRRKHSARPKAKVADLGHCAEPFEARAGPASCLGNLDGWRRFAGSSRRNMGADLPRMRKCYCGISASIGDWRARKSRDALDFRRPMHSCRDISDQSPAWADARSGAEPGSYTPGTRMRACHAGDGAVARPLDRRPVPRVVHEP